LIVNPSSFNFFKSDENVVVKLMVSMPKVLKIILLFSTFYSAIKEKLPKALSLMPHKPP